MNSQGRTVHSIIDLGKSVWGTLAFLVVVATIVPIWFLFLSPKPDVRYQIFGPFPSGSGSAYGIVIFNTGGEQAEDIRFSLKTSSTINSAAENKNNFVSDPSLSILDSKKEIFFSAKSFPPADMTLPSNQARILMQTSGIDDAQIIEVKCTFSKGLCKKDVYILPTVYKIWIVIATTVAVVMILIHALLLVKNWGVAFATPQAH